MNNVDLPIKNAIIDNEPWNKLPGETARSYSAFLAYRNLPASTRSLKRAAEQFYGEATASRVRLFQKWSAKFMWVDRSAAWDSYIVFQAQEDLVAKIKEMNERHIQIAKGLFAKALQRISKISELELTPMDALRFLNQGVALERLALGEPQTISEQHSDQFVESRLVELSDDELRKRLIEVRLRSSTVQTTQPKDIDTDI